MLTFSSECATIGAFINAIAPRIGNTPLAAFLKNSLLVCISIESSINAISCVFKMWTSNEIWTPTFSFT